MSADRDRLAAALPESLGPIALRRPSPPLIPNGRPDPRGYGDQILDALLPVVQDLVAERAAAELRAAADDLVNVPGNPYPLVVSEFLYARADALTAGSEAGT